MAGILVPVGYGVARHMVLAFSMASESSGGPGQLRVYHLALDLCDEVEAIVKQARCAPSLKDQVLRCAHSVVLNIAEGAGNMSPGKKTYHYQLANGESWECIAGLRLIKHADPRCYTAGANHKAKLVSRLLTSLIRKWDAQRN
jgi:four helix bundle protein